MVETFDEKKELEILKQSNKIALTELNRTVMKEEHDLKMIRLNKIADISRDGGHLTSV